MDKTEQAEKIIRSHMLWSAGSGLIPIPLVDLAAVTALQVGMLEQLAEVYGVRFSQSSGKRFVSALVGTGVASVGASAIKLIPGLGSFLGGGAMALSAAASTYGVGQVAIRAFEASTPLDEVDMDEAKTSYDEAVEEGKEIAAEMENDKEKA